MLAAQIRALPIAIALALACAAPAAALTPTVTTYPAADPPSATSGPNAIAAGPDGNLWFTDPYDGKIGRITVDGRLTLQAPLATGFQYDIAAGSDGAMWFVSQGPSSVGRIDGSGSILTRDLTNATANPTVITSGPDGAIWFNEAVGKVIARMPAQVPLAAPDESRTTTDGPTDIAFGPDGNLWFTMYSASEIGRMTPGGTTTYFPLPAALDNPEGIVAGPDGALWFTVLNPSAVVRIATDGTQQTFRSPVSPFSHALALGADGALWFTAFDEIVRVTTDGAFEPFPLPAGVMAGALSAGPDGNIWFTDGNGGRIGRITTPPNATTGGAHIVRARIASVGATVNGHSQPLKVTVEYGPVGGAMSTTPPVELPASAADQTPTLSLINVEPSTSYRYRVVATNPTGTTSGEFAGFTSQPAPKCRVTKTRKRKGGKIALTVACKSTHSVSARATIRVPVGPAGESARKRRPLFYGKGRARVVRGKATVRIVPKRRALAQLRLRRSLRVRVALKYFGGGTATTANKTVRVRQRR